MTPTLGDLQETLRSNGRSTLRGWTGGIEHLDRCRRATHPDSPCPDCEMHALSPGAVSMLRAIEDIAALARVRPSPASVIAVAELDRSVAALPIDGQQHDGMRAMHEALRAITDEHLTTLRSTVQASLAQGDSLAVDLEQSARLLAVPSLLAGTADLDLTAAASAELGALDELTGADRVAEVLVEHVDRAARSQLPGLATQPEWRRLPDTPSNAERLDPATLEDLVAESVADEVLDRATAIAKTLASHVGRSTVDRPAPTTAMTSATRALVWRRATINWPLSIADTGLAGCWDPDQSAARLRLTIPAVSALGLTNRIGRIRLVSALHGSPENGRPRAGIDHEERELATR